MNKKKENLKKRHKKIRARVMGTSQRPRLQVFRSLSYTYAQLIDDTSGKTICAVSDLKEKDIKSKTTTQGKKLNKTDSAFNVGEKLAKLAKEKKIEDVVFDRKGYLYHGRVKAVAEGARKGGLKF